MSLNHFPQRKNALSNGRGFFALSFGVLIVTTANAVDSNPWNPQNWQLTPTYSGTYSETGNWTTYAGPQTRLITITYKNGTSSSSLTGNSGYAQGRIGATSYEAKWSIDYKCHVKWIGTGTSPDYTCVQVYTNSTWGDCTSLPSGSVTDSQSNTLVGGDPTDGLFIWRKRFVIDQGIQP